MTAQVNDSVFHRKINYALAGISGSGLFEPEAHGLKPAAIFSACWRGYCVTYAIEDGRLVMTKVSMGFSREDEMRAKVGRGPTLFGVLARREGQRGFWNYNSLHERVAFTGGLLLAHGFIEQLYVHMGFHPAWKYRDVRELLFEDGHLRDEFDRSVEVEQVRVRFAGQPLKPDLSEGKARVMEWIEQCFSLDYRRSR